MVENSNRDLEAVFRRLPPLAGLRPDDFQIKPLPGFTNQNFHLKNEQHDWVLRIPKQETNRYINRQHEAHNTNLAYQLSIAPECIWRDESGLSLSMTLINSRSIDTTDIQNETILNDLSKTIGRLHNSKNKFQGRVELADLLTRYYQLVPGQLKYSLESGYKTAMIKLERLSARDNLLVPSHNDLVLENILIDAAGRVWLIDWEYASMASPYWDLATLCNAANFNQAQSAALLADYKKTNQDLDSGILTDYRYLLSVLSICWMAAFTEHDISFELEKLYD